MQQPSSLPYMGRKILFFLLPVLTIILIKCEDESPVSREYPRLAGTVVTNVSDSGATFSADLYSLGNEAIIESGFLWSLSNSDFSYSERVLLGIPQKTGNFSADINTTLLDGATYFVKPFVQTEKHFIYGPVVTFVSLGSKAPVITGFSPDSAAWGDTIKIYGRNFSWILNKIFLNSTECTMLNANDTVLNVQVTPYVNSIENNLSVEVAGNRATYNQKKFRLIPPRLTDFYPKRAYWGDTIYIRGNHLKYISMSQNNSIFLGSIRCPVLFEAIKDTLIKITVHNDISSLNSSLKINIGGFVLNSGEPLTILEPYFSFAPAQSNWNSVITLTGRFNSTLSKNSVYFNSIKATIISVTNTSMLVKVPALLTTPTASIKYDVTPFSVTAPGQFTLSPPVISSFTPVSGAGGTRVTIKGKYFNSSSCVVRFGDVTATLTSVNDSTVTANVPAGVFGPVKISVKIYSQEITSTEYFNITNPRITGINPLSGTFNDEITITGENFIPLSGSTTVSFGSYLAEIVSLSQNQIIAKVPITVDSIPAVIKVSAGQNLTVSSDKFTLDPHSVYSASGAYTPGGELHILGQNFNPNPLKNIVKWDFYQLTIKSATTSEIVALWPEYLPRGNYNIMVQTGGYKRFSTELFNINSAWVRIPSPAIATRPLNGSYSMGMRNYGGNIKGYGYVVSQGMTSTYRFDPADWSWTKLNIGYPYSAYLLYEASEAVINDTLYIVGGNCYSYNYVGAYDPVNNIWRRFSNQSFFQRTGVCFPINNRLWYGLESRYAGSNKFWEINPENKYSLTPKGDFPVTLPSAFASYFTLGNKGYVVFANNELWQFNPADLSWQRKNDFPGKARNYATAFVIGNYAYFGLGLESTTSLTDIWRYDYLTDSWSIITNIPGGRYGATVFTIDNKAYIGFGVRDGSGNLYDFYEFDPAY